MKNRELSKTAQSPYGQENKVNRVQQVLRHTSEGYTANRRKSLETLLAEMNQRTGNSLFHLSSNTSQSTRAHTHTSLLDLFHPSSKYLQKNSKVEKVQRDQSETWFSVPQKDSVFSSILIILRMWRKQKITCLTLLYVHFEKFVRPRRLVIIHRSSCILSRNSQAFMINCQGNGGTPLLHFNTQDCQTLISLPDVTLADGF